MKQIFFFTLTFLLLANYSVYAQKKVTETRAGDLITEIYHIGNGKKNGAYKEIYKKKKITEGNYLNDQRVGEWKFNDYSNRLNYKGNYVDGKFDGLWLYEYDGKVASELYFTKGEIDSVNGYHENGQIAYRLRYNTDNAGVVQSFYPNGQLKESFSVKGEMLDGTYSYYFNNGQLHREIEYKDGEKHSISEVFDTQGNLIAGGDLYEGTGRIILYYFFDKTDGSELKISAVQNYEKGTMVGEKEYRKDGQLMLKKSLTEDHETLIQRFYNNDGVLTHTQTIPYIAAQKSNDKRRTTFTNDPDMVVDVLPLFPSGATGQMEFFSKIIVYPREMQKNGASGRVICQFVVTPIGEITDVKIVQSAGKIFDDEAVRIIQAMPRFTPGLINGVPVRVRYTLPVNFQLNRHF